VARSSKQGAVGDILDCWCGILVDIDTMYHGYHTGLGVFESVEIMKEFL